MNHKKIFAGTLSTGMLLSLSPIAVFAAPANEVTNFHADSVNEKTLTLKWTDEPTAVNYNILRKVGDQNSPNTYQPITNVYEGVQQFQDYGLVGNTTYTYKIVGTDSIGENSPGTAITVKTAPDTTPPIDIMGLDKGTVTDSTIDFTWHENYYPSPDWAKVNVYRDGKLITSVDRADKADVSMGFNSFKDTNLRPGTTYHYVFKSVDTTGNESSGSTATIDVTTTGTYVPPTTEPPKDSNPSQPPKDSNPSKPPTQSPSKPPVSTPSKPTPKTFSPNVKKEAVVHLKGGHLNVRSGASTNSKVSGSLSNGQSIVVIGEGFGNDGKWLKVNIGGKIGYISSDYAKTSATTTTKQQTVKAIALNIRSSATDKEANKIGYAKKGQKIEVLGNGFGKDKSWSKINFNGKIAYVSTKYLQ